jgi:hypothetical protein
MHEFLQSTPAQAVIWVAVLLTIGSVCLYLVKWIRQWGEVDSEISPNELLTRFRGMQDEGDISQSEFKRIKSVLGEKLQHDLGSSDAEGDG